MESPGISPAAPLVLLVLRDATSRSAYAEALEGWGFRVAQAETAQLGLRSAWELGPDVIAVDVAGLGAEGARFLRGLWGVPATATIPLVRFCETSAGSAAGGEWGGATVELSPGCLPDQLLAAIQQLLPANGSHQAGNGKAPRAVPDVPPPHARPKRDRRRATGFLE